MKRKVPTKLKLIPTLIGVVFLLLAATVYVIFASYDYNTLKPEIARAFQDATGKELTLGGDISLKIGLTPTLVVRDVTIQNAPWGSQPELARIKRLEIKVRFFPLLAHRLDLIRVILIEPELLLETDTSGKSNLAMDAPVKDRTAEKGTDTGGWGLSRITFEEMRIEKGRVTYINHESKKRYTATVAVFTAGSTGPFGGRIRIEGKVAYNEEFFEVTGAVGSLATLADPALAWPVSLKLSMGDTVLAIDGSVNDPLARRGFRLYFSLKSKDPARLSRLSGLSKLPPLKSPLDISGRIIDTGKDSYSITDLKIMEGDNDLGGSVDLNLAGERPMVKATLSARKLDLRPYIGKGPDAVKTTGRGRIFSGEPLPFHALGKADAEVALRASQVLLPEIGLSDVNMGLTLKDEILDVNSLKAFLGKGSVDARLSVKPQGKTVLLTSSVKLHKVDITYLANIVKAASGVEGNLDADIDIRARGTSVAGLMGSLTGKAVLLMGKGRMHQKVIDLLGSDLPSGVFRLVNPFDKEKPYAAINCFVGAFTMNNGLARATTLVLNTQYMVVVGDGTINLKTERLNLSLRPVPKEGIGASPIGKLGISASELTRPFKLGGTLARPRLAIDPTRTAITLGRTIGAITLFGPAGIAAALMGKTSDEETSCAAAVSAAKKGVRIEKPRGRPGKGKSGDVLEDIGGKVKELFGR
ncbi:MAG TPA: hypothetical protein DDZ40_11060 [Deltaproteobacteria bacterium]|nr:hypothetical protein [Deltaproteobacteria bacterium]